MAHDSLKLIGKGPWCMLKGNRRGQLNNHHFAVAHHSAHQMQLRMKV